MRCLSGIHIVAGLILIVTASPCASAEQSPSEQSSKYLDAVREFADNVLKYGRDTYGPKHTPLFVDGLNIHTHEPVKWIDPNGDIWVLSNLASQQNLFRTLDGLSTITGDARYRQAAMHATKYAFENLRTPNGLLYWGGHSAYDAGADRPCGRDVHELKGFYPYYKLMWQVDPRATKQFVDAFWSGHVKDWSNLSFDRHCYNLTQPLGKPWDHGYRGGPVFFGGSESDMMHAGSDLFYAASLLTRLSGDEVPLVWGKRLARRYIEARNPQTGISPLGFKGKLTPYTYEFPRSIFSNPALWANERYYYMSTPGAAVSHITRVSLCQLLLSEALGSEGQDFRRWAYEELMAIGKMCYRKQRNVYVPISGDGASREGYVCAEDGPFGPKGTKLMAIAASPYDFLAYMVAYRITKDEFMWEMARDIAMGNGYGDIGASATEEPQLDFDSTGPDPYGLLGFLESYRATGSPETLKMAEHIADTMLAERFHNGFFVGGAGLVFCKFDAIDSLALLHLYTSIRGQSGIEIPKIWPGTSFFDMAYRNKEEVIDNLIYAHNELPLPISLQEAAAIADIDSVRSLIADGTDVDGKEDSFLKTALHHAAMNGHRQIAEFLLAKGADVNAKDSFPGATPLHYAAYKGYSEIAELLIAKGTDVNATRGYPAGDTPLHSAVRAGHKEVVELLIAHGGDVTAKNKASQAPIDIAMSNAHMDIASVLLDNGAEASFLTRMRVNMARQERRSVDLSLFTAAQNGEQEEVKALLDQGIDINAKNSEGNTPLYYALIGGHGELAQLLIEKGADVTVKDARGMTPLYLAAGQGMYTIVELILAHDTIDINVQTDLGWTPLHIAVGQGRKEVVQLLVARGANLDAKKKDGKTPLDLAKQRGHKEIAQMLIEAARQQEGN